jgi:hypothetical protein
MLKLQKKGEKFHVSKKSMNGVRGGGCGQGCSTSCPIGNTELSVTYYQGWSATRVMIIPGI